MHIVAKPEYPTQTINDYRERFDLYLPDVSVQLWNDPALDVEQVEYAMVYRPEPGFLASLPNLRVVFSTGAGVDHITCDPDYPWHVPLVRMHTHEATQQMAEHVLMCTMMSIRCYPLAMRAQQQSRWQEYTIAQSIENTTVGIMGLGNFGFYTAQQLHRSGFKVIGWSRSRHQHHFMDCYAGPDELADFLQRSQVLVCLLPRTDATHHILNHHTLGLLPAGASLINVGRGAHLNTDALHTTLNTQHLRYAFLDVFETEPLAPDSWLWQHPQVIITPHTAANATLDASIQYVADQIRHFEAGQALRNVYDVQRKY